MKNLIKHILFGYMGRRQYNFIYLISNSTFIFYYLLHACRVREKKAFQRKKQGKGDQDAIQKIYSTDLHHQSIKTT